MEFVIVSAIYSAAVVLSTLVFGTSLFLIEDSNDSSFQHDGAAKTWGKCAVFVVVLTVLGLLPYGGLVALVAFFAGVMLLFQKTFLQALLMLFANGAFSIAVAWVVGKLLAAVAPAV